MSGGGTGRRGRDGADGEAEGSVLYGRGCGKGEKSRESVPEKGVGGRRLGPGWSRGSGVGPQWRGRMKGVQGLSPDRRGKVKGVGGFVPDGRGALGKGEEGPRSRSRVDEGTEGLDGGVGSRSRVDEGVWGRRREVWVCLGCSRWALGVPRCERVRGAWRQGGSRGCLWNCG